MRKLELVVASSVLLMSEIAVAQSPRFLPPTPRVADPFLLRDTRMVLARDFDGDGRTDLLFGNTDSSSQLLRNEGSWRFEETSSLPAVPVYPAETEPAEAGDFDGDGDLDLALINASAGGDVARVYRNNGSSFAAIAGPASAYVGAMSLAVGDVDSDGDVDLVVGYYSAQVQLFLNNGSGAFTNGTMNLPVLVDNTWCVRLVDVDGDGDRDLLTGSETNLRLATNDGAGHFAEVTPTHMPATTRKVLPFAVGDIDGDGDSDLVLPADGNAPTAVYVNDGSGHFADQTAVRLPGTQLRGVTLFDADGDQDLDLVSVQPPRIHRNNGSGVFADATSTLLPSLPPAANFVAAGDLDGDGRTDACLAYGTGIYPDPSGRNVLLRNQTSGLVVQAPVQDEPWGGMLPVASLRTTALVLIDHNHDGDLDLVVGNDWGTRTRLYDNDGHGVFVDVTDLHMPYVIDAVDIAAGDANGDGFRDLVLAVWGGQSRLFLGSASGGFVDATAGRMPVATLQGTGAAMGDLDGDGDVDVLLGTGSSSTNGTCRVLRNNGLGAFVDLGPFLGGAYPVVNISLADVDSDGDLDVFAASPGEIYLNDGTGGLTYVPTGWGAPAGAFGDFDRDGLVDLAVSRYQFPAWRLSFVRNVGNGAFASPVDWGGFQGPSSTAQPVSRMIAADFDADGDLDVLNATVSGQGVFLGQNDGGVLGMQPILYAGAEAEVSRGAAVGDVDGDGDLDVVVGNRLEYPGLNNAGQTRLLANLTRHVSIDGPPRLGTTQVVRTWTLPPTQMQTAPRLAVTYASFGLLPSAVALPPFGNVQIDPTSIVQFSAGLVAPTAGNLAANLVIPNTPTLAGLSIYFQAIVEGRTSTGAPELRLTNALGQTLRP
jgi:hypothetical protein